MPVFSFGVIHLGAELLARSYGDSMFNLLRNCQTVLQSGSAILYSHQQIISGPFFSTSSLTFISHLKNFSCPGACAVVPHGAFGLHFLGD